MVADLEKKASAAGLESNPNKTSFHVQRINSSKSAVLSKVCKCDKCLRLIAEVL